MPSTIRALKVVSALLPTKGGSGVLDPNGDIVELKGPFSVLGVGCGYDDDVWPLPVGGLLFGAGLFLPPTPRLLEAKAILAAAVETGPLTVLLAPSPNPTRLEFPSSLNPPTLETPSSSPSLSWSRLSLPLAQVVRPPMEPVALALPTVLLSLK